MSTSRDLTSVDAGAALLALGASLQWDALHERGDYSEGSRIYARTETWCYSIVVELRYLVWVYIIDAFNRQDVIKARIINTKMYERQANAKVSCEFHYTTGKWE